MYKNCILIIYFLFKKLRAKLKSISYKVVSSQNFILTLSEILKSALSNVRSCTVKCINYEKHTFFLSTLK